MMSGQHAFVNAARTALSIVVMASVAHGSGGGEDPQMLPDGLRPYPFAVLEMPIVQGGTFSQAAGINNFGVVTGNVDGDLFPRGIACTFDDWGINPLPGHDGPAIGFRINDLGAVAGEVLSLPHDGAYWDEQGVLHAIPTFGDDGKSYVEDLNNFGEVVGSTRDVDGIRYGFIWSKGEMKALPVIDPARDYLSDAIGINDLGVVVGSVGRYDPPKWNNEGVAAVWENGIPRELHDPEDAPTTAYDINDAGYVVGWRDTFWRHPVVWEPDGTMRILKTREDRPEFYATRINNRNQVIGGNNDPRYLHRLDGTFVRLIHLFPPRHTWDLRWVDDINDHGQIVGVGYRNGKTRGYITTPVTPTFELSAVSPGEAGVLNSITVSNVTPGTQVYVVAGLVGGGAHIPGCTILDNAIQIDHPRLVGSGLSDSAGNLTISALVPEPYAGQTILFQAFIRETCEISNLIVQTFE